MWIYFLFGLAVVSLCVKAVHVRIQRSLENLGKRLLRNFVEFLQQMGFHELSTDDILLITESNPPPVSLLSPVESTLSRPHRLTRSLSTNAFDHQSSSMSNLATRPIGVAEPLRRSSAAVLIRSLQKIPNEDEKSTDKSVQVNTIIRSCGRCAGSSLSPTSSLLSVKRCSAVSSSSSIAGDLSSGCEDEDTSPALPPPNLDRLRQRRATLVAKTIISQMATQSSAAAADESIPKSSPFDSRRSRPTDNPPVSFKYKVKATATPPEQSTSQCGNNQEEFLEISKQISSLLTPSDEEN